MWQGLRSGCSGLRLHGLAPCSALALLLAAGAACDSDTRQLFPDTGADAATTADSIPFADGAPTDSTGSPTDAESDQSSPDSSGDVQTDAQPDGADSDALSDADGEIEDSDGPLDSGSSDTDGDAPSDTDASTEPLSPLPPRDCTVQFSYVASPGTTSVHVPGEANDWNPAGWPLADADGDGVWTGAIDAQGLTPGPYGYKILRNGTDWLFDPANPMRVLVDGFENSKMYVPNCAVPVFEVEQFDADAAAGTIDVVVAVRDGWGAPGISSATALAKLRHKALEGTYNAESQRFSVHLEGLEPGKHSLEFRVSNAAGEAEPLWLPIWLDPPGAPFDWRTSVLYFAFVDRFADGGVGGAGPGCLPADAPTTWRGGDWVGLRQKLEEGYFDDLGVTALWISAPNDNPDGCMLGDLPGQQYTAYHGYFPASNTAAEERFGGMQALRDLVDAAHARGIRVLADLVLNHVHESHPLVAAQPTWFNPICQCGGACDWNEKAEECWFQPYLPDLDFRLRQPVDEFANMAVYWAREADLDGFRVDAVKHVHPHMLLTLRQRLKDLTAASGQPLYLVGETYVGEWGGGNGSEEKLVKKYVGPDLLDGQFDFPLYWKVARAFARSEEDLSSLGSFVEQSEGYYGSGSVMSTFLGNHDVPRFASHAAGHIADVWGNGAKEQGISNPPPQPTDAEVYQRLRLAFAFLFSIDGVPLIYYGDEIGLAGAGDPDNRRLMPFSGWSSEQETTREFVGKLAQIRLAHPELALGTTQILSADSDTLVFARRYQGQVTVTALNRGGDSATVPVAAPPEWTAGTAVDALGGSSVSIANGSMALALPARSAMILSAE